MDHGESGLAALIYAIAAAMVLAGLLVVTLIGWLVARRLRLGRTATIVTTVTAGVIGAGLSLLAVVATFLEDRWSPPPHLRIVVPAGFKPHWVVLLEDPSAHEALVWHGVHAPFHGLSAEVTVPAGGILRVRSLATLAAHGGTTVEWSDGGTSAGFATGTAPDAVHAIDYAAYERPSADPTVIDLLPDGDALAAYIKAHGG